MNPTSKLRQKFAVVVILFMVAATAFSQSALPALKYSSGKNSIAISVGMRHHFDGAPIVSVAYRGKLGWLNPGLDLTYCRKIGEKAALSASLTSVYAAYWDLGVYPDRLGDMVQRNGFLAEIAYNRLFLKHRGWAFYGILGLQYRRGYEWALIGIRNKEPFTTWYNLRDPGITAGLSTTRHLFWRLEFNSSLKFTQYFFRFDDGSKHGMNNPNRSTRNLLRLQVGLGFRF